MRWGKVCCISNIFLSVLSICDLTASMPLFTAILFVPLSLHIYRVETEEQTDRKLLNIFIFNRCCICFASVLLMLPTEIWVFWTERYVYVDSLLPAVSISRYKQSTISVFFSLSLSLIWLQCKSLGFWPILSYARWKWKSEKCWSTSPQPAIWFEVSIMCTAQTMRDEVHAEVQYLCVCSVQP